MKYLMSAEWWKAAGIRAAKTMFQTGAALVVTQMPGGTVDWMTVGSAVIVAGVASLGTSLAGLPELEKGDMPAMIIAAFITFIPVAILVLGIILVAGYFLLH